MAIYDFKKKPALTTKEGEKEVLYPGIVYLRTISTKEILDELSQRTTFNVGEVEGALVGLVDIVGEYIGRGYRVELGDFGVFSGKLKSRMVADPKELRCNSIEFNGVNFRASKRFKSRSVGQLERDKKWKFRNSSKMNTEECRRRMLAHLDEHGFINRVTYTALTGRLKDVALKDLKEFAAEGLIERIGRGNQMHFVRTKDKPAE